MFLKFSSAIYIVDFPLLRFLCFCCLVLFFVLILANFLQMSGSPWFSFIFNNKALKGWLEVLGTSRVDGSYSRKASLWGDPVTNWAVSLEVSQMSVSVGLYSGTIHVLQRILQSPAKGVPGCHRSGSRIEVEKRGWGSHRQGADFCLVWCFPPDTSFPPLKPICHISHFISKLPITMDLTHRLHFLASWLLSLQAGNMGHSSFPNVLSCLFENKHHCPRLCRDMILRYCKKLNSMTT